MRTGVAGGQEPIEVVVDHGRRVVDPPGVRTSTVKDLATVAQLHLCPPRTRIEHAVLTVASRATKEDVAVAVVADACQSRRTTPQRLLEGLATRSRLRHRRLLLTILEDVACGAYSALERRYLLGVERPHGLPTGRRQRQVRCGRTSAYRDVDYVALRTLVELDGRLGHERAADRWADLERDLEALVSGDATARLGWRQVLEPCRSAHLVARLLSARGWTGELKSCGPDCARNRGASSAPGAGEAPLFEA